ncbi:hypothetical protein Droror1_Dr00000245 [Drosera rotundifolia]
MGVATSLYSASCFISGKYGNGDPYPVNLSAVVGFSGWLPATKFDSRYHIYIERATTCVFRLVIFDDKVSRACVDHHHVYT